MNVDYYALLTKAVEGKDAAARDRIYRDAYGLIRKSHLTREAASSHAATLESAIRRIEGELAAEVVALAAGVEVLDLGDDALVGFEGFGGELLELIGAGELGS